MLDVKEKMIWDIKGIMLENISQLNPYYCELTGLYWAWKNLDCDYLGLVHYRRYFTKKNQFYRENLKIDEVVLNKDDIELLL